MQSSSESPIKTPLSDGAPTLPLTATQEASFVFSGVGDVVIDGVLRKNVQFTFNGKGSFVISNKPVQQTVLEDQRQAEVKEDAPSQKAPVPEEDSEDVADLALLAEIKADKLERRETRRWEYTGYRGTTCYSTNHNKPPKELFEQVYIKPAKEDKAERAEKIKTLEQCLSKQSDPDLNDVCFPQQIKVNFQKLFQDKTYYFADLIDIFSIAEQLLETARAWGENLQPKILNETINALSQGEYDSKKLVRAIDIVRKLGKEEGVLKEQHEGYLNKASGLVNKIESQNLARKHELRTQQLNQLDRLISTVPRFSSELSDFKKMFQDLSVDFDKTAYCLAIAKNLIIIDEKWPDQLFIADEDCTSDGGEKLALDEIGTAIERLSNGDQDVEQNIEDAINLARSENIFQGAPEIRDLLEAVLHKVQTHGLQSEVAHAAYS